MRKAGLLLAIILSAVAAQGQTGTKGKSAGELSFGVTDARRVITGEVAPGLRLRAVKERSATQEHFGWRVEVVRQPPYRKDARNLLYHGRRTLGAHPSQVYAWHVTSGQFPNVRELPVEGRALVVRVELIDPVAEGAGSDSRFVSGEIKISWGPRRGA
ncbi:MAG TPA: hypothetical protein VK422_10795 [Pyrinomonadaceae bacterium]|nr:hypothetical protein [Pyrinomonadaceae bacterium]